MMSASLTTPTTRPPASQTGTPEIRCRTSSAATSFSVISGGTVTTAAVINCATFMAVASRATAESASDVSPRRPVANYRLRGTGAGSKQLDVERLRARSAHRGDVGARECVLRHTEDRADEGERGSDLISR